MFRHEGPSRDAQTNQLIAGYLAFVAGYVNSGGFVLIHSFTSHVTGSVGRLSTDLASGQPIAAAYALLLVVMFFVGAFVASVVIGAYPDERTAVAYAMALLIQGGLLAVFILVAGISPAEHPRVRDAEAAILCCALGMQNSLVTRLSGAVVRTTHLTGVVTDLAIEAAGLVRYYRAKLRRRRGSVGRRALEGPPRDGRALLLSVIIAAFVLGSLIGGALTMRASRWAMALPAVLVFALSAYAYSQRNAPASVRPPPTS